VRTGWACVCTARLDLSRRAAPRHAQTTWWPTLPLATTRSRHPWRTSGPTPRPPAGGLPSWLPPMRPAGTRTLGWQGGVAMQRSHPCPALRCRDKAPRCDTPQVKLVKDTQVRAGWRLHGHSAHGHPAHQLTWAQLCRAHTAQTEPRGLALCRATCGAGATACPARTRTPLSSGLHDAAGAAMLDRRASLACHCNHTPRAGRRGRPAIYRGSKIKLLACSCYRMQCAWMKGGNQWSLASAVLRPQEGPRGRGSPEERSCRKTSNPGGPGTRWDDARSGPRSKHVSPTGAECPGESWAC